MLGGMTSPTRVVVFIGSLSLLGPATASGQCDPEKVRRPIVLVSARYEVPLRAMAAAGLMVPVRPSTTGDLGCAVRANHGVIIEAGAGTGGIRVAGGFGTRVKESGKPVILGQDVLMTYSRTGDEPRKATAHSTYVGAEAGLTLIMVRFSVGVSRRLSGSEGGSATIFTWSVGLHTGW